MSAWAGARTNRLWPLLPDPGTRSGDPELRPALPGRKWPLQPSSQAQPRSRQCQVLSLSLLLQTHIRNHLRLSWVPGSHQRPSDSEASQSSVTVPTLRPAHCRGETPPRPAPGTPSLLYVGAQPGSRRPQLPSMPFQSAAAGARPHRPLPGWGASLRHPEVTRGRVQRGLHSGSARLRPQQPWAGRLTASAL